MFCLVIFESSKSTFFLYIFYFYFFLKIPVLAAAPDIPIQYIFICFISVCLPLSTLSYYQSIPSMFILFLLLFPIIFYIVVFLFSFLTIYYFLKIPAPALLDLPCKFIDYISPCTRCLTEGTSLVPMYFIFSVPSFLL